MEDDKTITITSMDGKTDTITITSTPVGIGDIWIDTNNMSVDVYDVNHEWITLDDTIDLSEITLNIPVEFEDCMPDVAKVEDMCSDYPALRKAYENFKTIYAMVHQDWQGKQDAENK